MDILSVFYVLVTCNLLAIGVFLYAAARVGKFMKSCEQLDWEAIAALTGDVGTLKKAVQKVNNRINGLESSNPEAVLSKLPVLQQNVTPITENKQIGG